VIFLIAFGLLMRSLIKNAPEGYEDEDGFHLGKPKDQCD